MKDEATTLQQVEHLAAAMRAAGAGRATLDGLSLDLSVSPLPQPSTDRAAAPVVELRGQAKKWDKMMRPNGAPSSPAVGDNLDEDRP